MEIRLKSTGQVMLENEFRNYLASTSGASYDTLTQEVADLLQIDVVFEGPQATGGNKYEYSQRQGVVEINGKWFTNYVLGPTFTEYTDDNGIVHSSEEQMQNYINRMDEQQATQVRQNRNRLLNECDWTQVADSPVNSGIWAT